MKKIGILLLIVALVYACATEQAPKEVPAMAMKMTKPSELALLMKEIHKDAKGWRTDLLSGMLHKERVEIYNKLASSKPTKANVEGPAFLAFSANYQKALDGFTDAQSLDLAKGAYNNLVTACVQCHQSYCTGPIPTIEKLYIKNS